LDQSDCTTSLTLFDVVLYSCKFSKTFSRVASYQYIWNWNVSNCVH